MLTSLVDRSLVQTTTNGDITSRYQLLETVRLYGFDRLAATGTADDIRDRHAEWVRAGCSPLATTGAFDFEETLYWLSNVDNVLSAADWYASNDEFVAAAEVLSGQSGLLYGDRNVDAVRWFTPAFVENEYLPDDVAIAVASTAAPPIITGHEGSGVVDAVGDGVVSVAVGDHVVLTFDSCGDCAKCRTGRPAYCDTMLFRNLSGRALDGSTGSPTATSSNRSTRSPRAARCTRSTPQVCLK